MPCPICDHAMISPKPGVYWCPRCGTLRIAGTVPREFIASLVGRCQQFGLGLIEPHVSTDCLRDNWKESGIAESINKPEDRK